MRSKRGFSEQLTLPFRATHALPFPVSPRSIRICARRELARAGGDLARLEDVALVRTLRRKYRTAVRRSGNAAAFAASPEGRRAHAAIDTLVMKLCG